MGTRISEFELPAPLPAAGRHLTLANRQRTRRVELRRLRCAVKRLLEELLNQSRYDLGFYLVGATEMTRLNETYLRHEGSTDVITFDYSGDERVPRRRLDRARRRSATAETPGSPPMLHGEIFVCVDEALVQARRFGTSWQSEVNRYIIHGVLHLQGHDDRRPSARSRMKREENRLLRRLELRGPKK